MNRIRRLVLISLVAVQAQAQAAPLCSRVVLGKLHTQTISWRNKPAEIHVLTGVSSRQKVGTGTLPAALRDHFVIGFSENHAFAYYDGKKIETRGYPGEMMKSNVHTTPVIGVPVLALIKVTEREAQGLKSRFQIDRSAFSCAGLACTYVRDFDPGLLRNGFYMTPSSMLTAMVDLSVAHPNRVKIVTMENVDLPTFIEDQSHNGNGQRNLVFKKWAPYIGLGTVLTGALAALLAGDLRFGLNLK